jgi:hypothetical protein
VELKKYINAINAITSELFSIFEKNIKKNAEDAVTEVDKATVKMQESWLELGKTAIGALNDLASGNYFGAAIKGIKVVFGAIDNIIRKSSNLSFAALEDLRASLKISGEAFLDFANSFVDSIDTSSIDEVYKSLSKLAELPTFRIDNGVDDTFDRRINQEIKIGEEINANYETAIDAENKLHDTKVANINKSHEEEATLANARYNNAVDSINKIYSQEIQNINIIYDLETGRIKGIYDLKSQQRKEAFNAESIGIQAGVNAELFGFIQNNDAKLALTSDYEGRKAGIISTFAAQIIPITEGMTTAEIAGINAAIAARDAALGSLEEWHTAEITFFLSNNKLRADSYTATEAIIQKGKDDTYNLGLKFAAQEIKDNALRDTAFEIALQVKNDGIIAAEIVKNADLAVQATLLSNALQSIEIIKNKALESEAKRFNDAILKLGVDRDALLALSFTILKDLVNKGYDDMIAKAQAAYDAGKITFDQFNELSGKLANLQTQVNGFEFSELGRFLFGVGNAPAITIPKIELDAEVLRLLANLPSFDVGTDNTSFASSGSVSLDSNGGYLAKLHKNEAILNSNEMDTLTKANNGVRPTRADIIGKFTAHSIPPVMNIAPYQNITKTMNNHSPYVIEKKAENSNRLHKELVGMRKDLRSLKQESFHVNMNEAGFSKYLLTKGSKINKLNSKYIK